MQIICLLSLRTRPETRIAIVERVNGHPLAKVQSNPLGGAMDVRYTRRSADGISATQACPNGKMRR